MPTGYAGMNQGIEMTHQEAKGMDKRSDSSVFHHRSFKVARLLKLIQACRRPKNQLSISGVSCHEFVGSLHPVGENGPSEQWPNSLKCRDLKRKQEEAGKLRERCLRMQMGLICQISEKKLHSSVPGEAEEVINAANHFTFSTRPK